MPTLTIGDKKITVGDDFLALPEDQKSATVDEIAKSMGLGSSSGGGTPETQTPPSSPGVLDKLVSQIKGGVQTMGSDIGGGGSLAGVLPTGLLRGAGQILSAPINALSGAATAPLEDIKPPGSKVTIKEARNQGQLLPLESPQDVLETSLGLTMPGNAKMVKGAVEVPSQEDLLGVYKPLKESGQLKLKVQPEAMNDLRESIRDSLHESGFRPLNHGSVFGTVDELQPEIKLTRKGKEVTKPAEIMDIEATRRALNEITDPGQKAAARHARDMIDDYLSEFPDAHVEGGPSVGSVLKEVRKNYSQGKKAARISEAMERGEAAAERSGSGANLDNALRQQIDKIISSKKESRFFTKEELEVLKEARKGGSIANAARLLSKFGPKHPITGWGSAMAADAAGGMGSASATLAAGHIAQMISEGARAKDILRIEEGLRKGSPIYQKRLEAAPMVPHYPGGAATFNTGIASLLSRLGGQDGQNN